MGAKKYPIRLRYKATVAADGTGYVRSEILHRNRVIACQSIGFRNRTGARGTVEAYIKQGAARTFIFDQGTPAANRWYWYPYTQFIKEGEQIEIQQASCSADDVLDLHIVGYTIFGPEALVE
uniref:Uncharacterized protein n=1 Tax=viral metagenome TaxID=1070528 RepID=A0A6H1ZR55_9ZZZZ